MLNTLRTVVFFLFVTGAYGLIFFSTWIHPVTKTVGYIHTFQTKILGLLAKKDKTPEEIRYVKQSITTLGTQTVLLADTTAALARFIPLANLKTAAEATFSLAVFSSHLDGLLGKNKETNYILFFLNNYELRPGGGFIGSIGKVTMKNYTLTRFDIEDVYEIDGQVTDYYEPHFAVKTYLNQPHEFLRDSNFSPDFKLNTQKALPYLAYVPGYNVGYTGAVGITTTAFEKLLEYIGPVYLSDYNVTINSSNFFEITQNRIENDFFPGSDQKRNLLRSLSNVSMARLEKLPPHQLLTFLYSSLNTKDIVLYSGIKKLQTIFTSLNWSGTQTRPLRDYIFPVNTNTGVNKVNKYIKTSMELQIVHKPPRQQRIFKTTYINSSKDGSPFGGTYKNYFQLYTPGDTVLKNITVNNRPPTTQTRTTDENGYRVYAVYIEVPPQTGRTITITYESQNTTPYDFPYNLTVQKQIGSGMMPLRVIYSNGDKTIVTSSEMQSDREFILK